ncbi:pilin [Algiphilus aromaticivorans]|uniref:pilin n=1 Tax=Algiphilus aromaticivorans TaxID=382454 RepID=UPI0005C15406
MKQAQQGFTLIELMIVVAIIGILAAIAIPAYQDYTVRAKMTEAVTAIGSAKASVSEFFISEGAFPAGNDEAGITVTQDQSDVVDSVSWDGTDTLTVTLEASFQDGELTGGETFELVATSADNGVSWNCQAGTGGNAIPTKYLPSNCR